MKSALASGLLPDCYTTSGDRTFLFSSSAISSTDKQASRWYLAIAISGMEGINSLIGFLYDDPATVFLDDAQPLACFDPRHFDCSVIFRFV